VREWAAAAAANLEAWWPQGVFVDREGYVAEGSVMNLGIITQEGELVVPPFEHSLPGCTIRRLLHLLQEVCVCFLLCHLSLLETHTS
jgi:branched-subunit amino acid aminotransferase/4-amino-4-deoxychorismate lyase